MKIKEIQVTKSKDEMEKIKSKEKTMKPHDVVSSRSIIDNER